MRAVVLGILGVSALALGACMPRVNVDSVEAASLGGTPLRALARLDCPEREGALERIAQADDGLSCAYDNRAGETVRLRLVALNGLSPQEAMGPTKAELQALRPVHVGPVRPLRTDEPGERTDVDLPFFHIHESGDRAEVKIFGIRIHADGDRAEVRTNRGLKHTVVHAGPQGAEIVAEDVGRRNASLVYVLASDRRSASPYRAVGYIAKGPTTGPLVVAEFRARGGHREVIGEGGDHGDVGRLVDRNFRD
jgi:hypothetical protein